LTTTARIKINSFLMTAQRACIGFFPLAISRL
jgi:hypothetical protein